MANTKKSSIPVPKQVNGEKLDGKAGKRNTSSASSPTKVRVVQLRHVWISFSPHSFQF